MSAEKVSGFPQPARARHAKYPWQQIAEDGGVWRLDPAEYDTNTPRAVGNAAHQWGTRHGYKPTTQVHDGCLFVQFTTLNGRAS
jgi:hypothetical protein